MYYFVPMLKLASQLPEQKTLEDKLGGVPWGLPKEKWPNCSMCKKPQTLLAQFVHNEERLNLGKSGRVLFIFQCNYDPGNCETWDANSGANSCFVLDHNDLTEGLTALPASDVTIETEARVEEWIRNVEDLEQAVKVVPYKFNTTFSTKLGGLPNFIQGEDETPGESYRFVGQLDYMYNFYSELPDANDVGCDVIKFGRLGRTMTADQRKPNAPPHFIQECSPSSEIRWNCDGANFGDAGMGYIYLKVEANQALGHFFWQCG
ncbi:MAG: hypothetical protein WCT03_14195 [Candidatus Obscuribacterales bacterium]|jgi:uncharacterized protein YwqG